MAQNGVKTTIQCPVCDTIHDVGTDCPVCGPDDAAESTGLNLPILHELILRLYGVLSQNEKVVTTLLVADYLL